MASRSYLSDLTTLTDVQLLELLKIDRMDAFDELYDRYWKKLYIFAYKRVRSKDVAEEIVQEFLTNFWTKRSSLGIKSSFEGYIFTSVRNLVINFFAREARRDAYCQIHLRYNHDVDTSTEENIYAKDLYSNLQKELSYLPSKCRSVFELSRKEHKSNKEIAEELGISVKTVESHLTKAIKRLRFNLNSFFLLF